MKQPMTIIIEVVENNKDKSPEELAKLIIETLEENGWSFTHEEWWSKIRNAIEKAF